MKRVLLLSILVTILFSLTLVSAYVYDDFSGSTLDLTKWAEYTHSDMTNQHVDEHYLNPTEGAYHTAQLTVADRGTLLLMNLNMSVGETLEYDVNYLSGSGNRLSSIMINGITLDLRMRDIDGYNPPDVPQGSGAIGYWNGEKEGIGNAFGIYHVKLTFNTNTVDISITKPDNSIWNWTTTQTSSPYSIGVVSRTGHNGLLHFDYDNFTITGFPPTTTTTTSTTTTTTIPCNCTELTERVEELESRTSALESIFDDLKYYVNLIICRLLPRGLRKGVTCPVFVF